MAATLVISTMGKDSQGQKPLHPLFQQPNTKIKHNTRMEIHLPASPSSVTSTSQSLKPINNESNYPSKQGHRIGSSESPRPISPASLEQNASLILAQQEDLNTDRRKRRRTESPSTDNVLIQHHATALERPHIPSKDCSNRKEYSFAPDTSLLPQREGDPLDFDGNTPTILSAISHDRRNARPRQKEDSKVDGRTMDTGQATPLDNAGPRPSGILATTTTNIHNKDRSQKLLSFNPKTGTIGSPPAKKKAGTKEKQARAKQNKSQVVTISYTDNAKYSEGLGEKIDRILSSPPRPHTPTQKKRGNKACISEIPKTNLPVKITKSPPQPGKPIHPLFTSKAAPAVKPSQSLPSTTKTNIVTLTTPKRPVSPQPTTEKQMVPTAFAGFKPFAKLTKFPGAINPAWPWKEMVHIRGHEMVNYSKLGPDREFEHHALKAKFTSTTVAEDESVLRYIAKDLDFDQVLDALKEYDMDDWPPPPQTLQVPMKHIESGKRIQARTRQELRYFCPLNKSDSTTIGELSQQAAHPALSRVYESISTTLSAFDVGNCETQTWAQKYSPKCASDVLQSGREALILKEWLQTLIVKSVEGGISDRSKVASNQHLDGGAKRKRKTKKADDFIVSDGEIDAFDEISEPEDGFDLQSNSTTQKTVVRSGGKDSKMKNAVLMSGPSGCGKSATVYAVAKELGFEVFEINSSSRRSGKDIMEKVGDMTRNHLVQRQQNVQSSIQSPLSGADEESHRAEQALVDEISSGRQGTMNSFFKVKDKPKAKGVQGEKKSVAVTTHDEGKLRDVPLSKPVKKEQKQSLILIEEIDILYEEDKNFWTTVLGLIVSSKRPLIMTCNNELAIQADLDPHLHAILRLTAPPLEMATDYLLMVAAAEGHVLDHAAVKDLYENRHFDLRASIHELNFWCQFAVGDQKHGGDWYYRRQPGKDLDNQGDPMRVVSQGTYSRGVEWISGDCIASSVSDLTIEEEVFEELWDRFELDAGAWQSRSYLTTWAEHMSPARTSSDKLDVLRNYQEYTDAMSVSDICSGMSFASHKQAKFDPSQPPLPTKTLDDFPVGRKLLYAPSTVQHYPLSKHISYSLWSRARNLLHTSPLTPPLPPRRKDQYNSLILQHVNDQDPLLTRHDLCLAFDPISFPPVTASLASTLAGNITLEPSVFDRTTTILATDVAPFVRGIIAYESRLQQIRLERSGLLHQDGSGRAKKARMTRSAMSALEGGARSTTRREKWFDAQLNSAWVFKTGGQWGMALTQEEGRRRDDAIRAIKQSQALGQPQRRAVDEEQEKDLMMGFTNSSQEIDV